MLKPYLKKLFVISSFLVTFTITTFAQSYPLGYCNDLYLKGVGEDKTTKVYELGAAIQLDEDKVRPFVGHEISTIRIGLANNEKDPAIVTSEDLKVFIRSSLTGENLYVQEVKDFTKPNGWMDIKLDTPFPIDGKEIFVGYSLKANALPLGFDSTEKPDRRATWVGVDNKWISYTDGGNASIYAMVTGDKIVNRKVLLEHFTTAQCVNCPPVHKMLETILDNKENVVWVAHHTGYMSDNYTMDESVEYKKFFYKYNGELAPTIMFDRRNLSDYGAVLQDATGNQVPSPGPVFLPLTKDMVEGILGIELERPAFVTLNITESFNPDNRELSVTVSGKATIMEFLSESVRLNLFLTEDGIIGNQSGGGSNYVHNQVMRAVMTGTWGDEVAFDNDGNFSKTYKCILKSNWVPAKMKIAAFLNNYDSKNSNNNEVFNAESYNLNLDPSFVRSETDETNVRVYSNNSLILIEGEFVTATIYDMTGKTITSLDNTQKKLSVSNGIYLVKVLKGEQTLTYKVIVNN